MGHTDNAATALESAADEMWLALEHAQAMQAQLELAQGALASAGDVYQPWIGHVRQVNAVLSDQAGVLTGVHGEVKAEAARLAG